MKILLDTNIVLDIFLNREHFSDISSLVLKKAEQYSMSLFITASTITDIHYILRKEVGLEQAIFYIKNILNVIDIISVDKNIILAAVESDWKDFEDAVQGFSALYSGMDMIITRNILDYKTIGNIEILTPNEFCKKYK